MGGGGKSRETSSTQTVELPPGLDQGANEVLAAGMGAASLPYTPNRGVTVAGFTPQQIKAMQGTNMQASAFGLPSVSGNSYAAAGLAAPTGMTAFGTQGYSTGQGYDRMKAASVGPEYQRNQRQILGNYKNAAGRIYEAADIDPSERGIFDSPAVRAARAPAPPKTATDYFYGSDYDPNRRRSGRYS